MRVRVRVRICWHVKTRSVLVFGQTEYEAFVLEAHSELGTVKSSDVARESALQHLKIKVTQSRVVCT
jgi:hypothetical protein